MKLRQLYGDIRVIKYYADKYSDSTSLHIQLQHWEGELQLSIKFVALGYFNNDNIVRELNPPSYLYSYLSEDNN